MAAAVIRSVRSGSASGSGSRLRCGLGVLCRDRLGLGLRIRLRRLERRLRFLLRLVGGRLLGLARQPSAPHPTAGPAPLADQRRLLRLRPGIGPGRLALERGLGRCRFVRRLAAGRETPGIVLARGGSGRERIRLGRFGIEGFGVRPLPLQGFDRMACWAAAAQRDRGRRTSPLLALVPGSPPGRARASSGRLPAIGGRSRGPAGRSAHPPHDSEPSGDEVLSPALSRCFSHGNQRKCRPPNVVSSCRPASQRAMNARLNGSFEPLPVRWLPQPKQQGRRACRWRVTCGP